MKKIILLLLCLSNINLFAQKLERIEPMFWFTGMKQPKLQLLVHGEKIASTVVRLVYPGVKLVKVNKVENPNYLFLDLEISAGTKAGKFPIEFIKDGKKLTYTYELKQKDKNPNLHQGVTNKDLIYLIMPDRFSNGDNSNDVIEGMQETALNRDSMYYRHGGDIKGIINHLDYLKELGITTLWLNPVLENDQPKTSYHGYANTENYKIDRRFGTNEDYKRLVNESHKRGMKVIKDLVHNHVGTEHFTIKDMPMKNWVHQWPAYTKTTYREQVHMDPYVAKADKELMVNGWFDKHMPDMNEENPYVKNYITQSHIWWVEYANLDGFRIDTYSYNDQKYMAEWANAITAEYPKLTFFGETWVYGVANQAYFTEGNKINQGFDTKLQGVTDFQALWGINEALNGKFGWMDGVVKLYNTFANDFMYKDPTRNVVFLDNHDLSRFYSVVGEDFNKYKSGLAWLLTTRGIPQLYYGTEILMKNFASPDGLVREDFPGGWEKDKKNKFTADGRTAKENEAFNYLKTLANYRKNNPVLQTGKMMQFVPEDGIYVYFRYNSTKTIMIIMNSNTTEKVISTNRYHERILLAKSGLDIVSNQLLDLNTVKLPALTTLILELK
ncbi:glycoside hydrolase family 13 protein [Pedobacter sp. Du54]|uniref:glycoside hydrolase family 13 protein n=1 Tax=Pedobacter anseongensis TaxID=3133439 RepID=UPI0030B37834